MGKIVETAICKTCGGLMYQTCDELTYLRCVVCERKNDEKLRKMEKNDNAG